MASYQTTGSYLRNSVFDAALEIGLGDPNLSNWLDNLPEVAEEKTDNSAPFQVPSSTAAHEPWISSPDSELSHSSTANTLTTITSNSSQGSFHYTTPSRHPNPSPRITTPRAVLPDRLELKGSNTNAPTSAASENTLHSSPFILPLQPQKRAPTKLLKKGRGDKKGSREKDQDNNSNVVADGAAPPAVPAPYSFLQHEPTPPPSDHEKAESKGFFGRLRDRSRSKSRARKARPSEDVEEHRGGKDADLLLSAATAAAGGGGGVGDGLRRGREFERKAGGVTVVKVNEGLPQLQLDPLSNRKSADLLSALTAEFSLVAATAAESSEKEKEAIAAYYAGVINPPPAAKPVEQQQPTSTAEFDVAASPSQPIPRLKSVMDRPHPKVRTSGFWANKDRGVVVPGAANRRVARKASASRRASVRGAVAGGAGVRRAPSHKRKSSALGGNIGKATAGGSRASRRLSINGLIDAIREEGVAGTEETTTTDFEEVETDSDDDDALNRPTSLPYSAQPAKKKGSPTSDSEPVPAIPVIIERRPSTKSTRSSKPNLSLTLSNLAPIVPGSTPITRLSPSSPLRSPGSRFRRSSHGSGLPSPLKPPPTSPLPPTPDVGGAQVLSVADRPQSGVVTPIAAKAVLATMPSPRQSDWFEDEEEDSDVDVGRRTPFSRTPGTSRPASPSDEWIVPTPTSVVTTFQPPPPPTEFNQPIPRPILTGRAPATAEARARATASAAMSRTGSTLVIPTPNGIPATPRRPGTSPQPTGRVTPGHLRVRPAETLRGTTPPPPSTWNPPTSALTRISSLRSQRGREPEGQKQLQQPQQQQQQQARSHSRDDSNGSNASGSQRGRMSPFPVRPGGSRDVSPLPSLKRTPSKMSIRQKTERVRSHHAEVGGDFDVEAFGRQSGESVRSGESEGWATASSARSSNEGSRSARPGNYNGVPREAYMPSPSPMTARRPSMHSRGPSPLPPLSATLPLNPSPHRPGSRMASPNPAVGRPAHPTLRPSASFTIPRPQQFSASNLAPSSSLRIDRNSRASMRSAYSALSDDDDARSFRGLDLDDEEDRPVAGKGFDVIAARLGDPSSKSAKLLQRLAVEDAEEAVLPPKGRGSGVTRPPAPSLLKVPQRPMTGPNSPNLSPRLRNTPTPTSAGGARWI